MIVLKRLTSNYQKPYIKVLDQDYLGGTVENMSRLKRKKKNNHPPFDETSANCEEANKTPNTLMNVTSASRIFERAIASAEKHGIRLKPGKKKGVMEIAATSQLFSTSTRGVVSRKSYS